MTHDENTDRAEVEATDAPKELTLEDLIGIAGAKPKDDDGDDEETEYPQRKSRYPKAPISF